MNELLKQMLKNQYLILSYIKEQGVQDSFLENDIKEAKKRTFKLLGENHGK